jgi:hypothetical protein
MENVKLKDVLINKNCDNCRFKYFKCPSHCDHKYAAWEPILKNSRRGYFNCPTCVNGKYSNTVKECEVCNRESHWKEKVSITNNQMVEIDKLVAGVSADAPTDAGSYLENCEYGKQGLETITTSKQAGKFEHIGRALGELVDEKQQAYGDAITAVEQMMKVLYPSGVKVEQYRDMLLIVRIMDKQCRIAKGDKKAFSESPFMDIGGYSLLGVGHE